MGQRKENNEMILIGAGLAGSLLSIYLAKKGFNVDVYEQRPDMRIEDISAGRSINLALSVRGLRALKEVGMDQKILEQAIPMKGRVIHAIDNSLTFQLYGRYEHQVINSVPRKDLNVILMDYAEKIGEKNIKFHFNEKATDFDFKNTLLTLYNQTKYENASIKTKGPVIGTDGSASIVRNGMITHPRFNLNQFYLDHGYKELTIPPGERNSFLIEKTGLHIWPRKKFMLIALPNIDGSFTCTLFLPFEGEKSFENLSSEEKVEKFFNSEFPDVIELIPNISKEFFENPTGSLVTVKCYPWHVKDKSLLIGDAAHAIVPFYGQGINAGFEDCRIFNSLITEDTTDWEKVFVQYEQLRKRNTDAIADLAIDNFLEMRDKVANPKFLIKKQVEKLLEKEFSDFLSTYSRVTFNSDIPYAEAQKMGKMQDSILEEECYKVSSMDEIDLNILFQKINKALSK
ncbi:MAG: FAD-dependent oxidoreductase [Candidatus Hodarchaeales archaeon]